MRKFFLSFVLCLCGAFSAFAQNSLLATLSHDGTVSTFYGAGALQEAHASAADGDVITLSSGTFLSTDITKAITLRGAGMQADTLRGTLPTILSGSFNINVSDTLTNRLTIEGIYNNNYVYVNGILKNAMILKSRFKNWSTQNKGVMKNVSFIHCRVSDQLSAYEQSTYSCMGCYVNRFNDPSSVSTELTNCVINNANSMDGKTSVNCIFRTPTTGYCYNSFTVAYNCVAFGSTNYFRNVPNNTNKVVNNANEIFKTYTGTYSDSETFELTESAKTTYLGMDGTQVGIHGGSLPFDATPSNPQITKCNVAAKSTADGKLSVDITVNAAE
ncbi:MAG: hypothetical protein J6B92_09350 [Paraprevotella sp.]|nr:hypothetical protein [Paraprevotella sp.]MBP3471060.1 hypothetical protein [Paraprevotella sp.]